MNKDIKLITVILLSMIAGFVCGYVFIKIQETNCDEEMRKEAIEYVYKHIQEYDVDGTFTNLDEFDFIASPQTLLNILNKGDNNGK